MDKKRHISVNRIKIDEWNKNSVKKINDKKIMIIAHERKIVISTQVKKRFNREIKLNSIIKIVMSNKSLIIYQVKLLN